MEREQLRAAITETLAAIAPEVDGYALDDELPLRRQVDLDSMDWLNFLIGLHARLGVDIPEADYHLLVSIANLLDYLEARL